MDEVTTRDSGLEKKTGFVKPSFIKKRYKPPSLARFGALGRLTQGSGGNGEDANFTMTKMCDRRIKHHLVHVGNLQCGVGLYLFDYLPEFRVAGHDGRQLGVMADEVERVMPEAVSFHADGYKTVDYAKLDIKPSDVVAALLH